MSATLLLATLLACSEDDINSEEDLYEAVYEKHTDDMNYFNEADAKEILSHVSEENKEDYAKKLDTFVQVLANDKIDLEEGVFLLAAEIDLKSTDLDWHRAWARNYALPQLKPSVWRDRSHEDASIILTELAQKDLSDLPYDERKKMAEDIEEQYFKLWQEYGERLLPALDVYTALNLNRTVPEEFFDLLDYNRQTDQEVLNNEVTDKILYFFFHYTNGTKYAAFFAYVQRNKFWLPYYLQHTPYITMRADFRRHKDMKPRFIKDILRQCEVDFPNRDYVLKALYYEVPMAQTETINLIFNYEIPSQEEILWAQIKKPRRTSQYYQYKEYLNHFTHISTEESMPTKDIIQALNQNKFQGEARLVFLRVLIHRQGEGLAYVYGMMAHGPVEFEGARLIVEDETWVLRKDDASIKPPPEVINRIRALAWAAQGRTEEETITADQDLIWYRFMSGLALKEDQDIFYQDALNSTKSSVRSYAMQALNTYLQKHPDDIERQYNFGIALSANRTSYANKNRRIVFENALAINEYHVPSLIALSILYLKGYDSPIDLEKAHTLLRRALLVAPENPTVHFYLAETIQKKDAQSFTKQLKKARHHYRQALKWGPAHAPKALDERNIHDVAKERISQIDHFLKNTNSVTLDFSCPITGHASGNDCDRKQAAWHQEEVIPHIKEPHCQVIRKTDEKGLTLTESCSGKPTPEYLKETMPDL